MKTESPNTLENYEIGIATSNGTISGLVSIPQNAKALVLFAHGAGSSRQSPRNRFVAGVLNQAVLATLLMDLLTPQEEATDLLTGRLRFDIDFLARRLTEATQWVRDNESTRHLPVSYFGASTGAAAALKAATQHPERIKAVVSRGGRPDMADDILPEVKAPTLLIVGSEDHIVLDLNRNAFDRLTGQKELVIIPGATHLFEEPGTLKEVADSATQWFLRYA